MLRISTYFGFLLGIASMLALATPLAAVGQEPDGKVPDGPALPVPEPQTFLYVGGGLLVLAIALRRRRRIYSVG